MKLALLGGSRASQSQKHVHMPRILQWWGLAPLVFGADAGGRTRMRLRAADFKSALSTNSSTSAYFEIVTTACHAAGNLNSFSKIVTCFCHQSIVPNFSQLSPKCRGTQIRA